MTILDEIIFEKEKEVSFLKKYYQKNERISQKSVASIYDSFRSGKQMNIIAEIKRASPSKGNINIDVDPIAQAKQYQELGANAISVLTDGSFFKGSMNDLQAIREVVDLPILCKDFMIDLIQIDRAKEFGANIILLIVAALSKQRLEELYRYAKSLHLDVLVEVHNEEELETALQIGANIIGINNRSLKTFAVDLAVTERLAKRIDRDEVLIIGESGIKNKQDVERMKNAGAKGILVGETLMSSPDLSTTFQQLQIPL
ncbi:indole-3-glycerol phosphate synthase TrpC [Heyndrickxia oleronia]|uniref:indole-3-glycerol phosphate synthase TrpC n=1 Tax=Heyndrickxia oleronia TaxID=38875 RepID=UPI001F29F089|nr:indole-3-glycerol phosphate synthase TrpC [Heyndrickxia oleronia]